MATAVPKIIVEYLDKDSEWREFSAPEKMHEMLVHVVVLSKRTDVKAVRVTFNSLGGTNTVL